MQSAGFEHAKLDWLGSTIKVILLSSSLKEKKKKLKDQLFRRNYFSLSGAQTVEIPY